MELRAHVYEDVLPALTSWQQHNLDVRIFSSGSVRAQHLFFEHTIEGDLQEFFRGHYDTTTGSKRDAASYQDIASQIGQFSVNICCLSVT